MFKLPCLTQFSSCSKRVYNCLHGKSAINHVQTPLFDTVVFMQRTRVQLITWENLPSNMFKLPCLTKFSSCSERVLNWLHGKTCHQTCSNSPVWHSCLHVANACSTDYMRKPCQICSNSSTGLEIFKHLKTSILKISLSFTILILCLGNDWWNFQQFF